MTLAKPKIRRPEPLPEILIGQEIGKWKVINIIGTRGHVVCVCGTEQRIYLSTLRYHHSTQCIRCRDGKSSARKGRRQQPQVTIANYQKVIKSLAVEQQRYAAELIKSRRQLDAENEVAFTQRDYFEALEMARAITPERAAEEVALLHTPNEAAVYRQYPQYISPSKDF